MSNKQTDYWAEETKEQIMTAVLEHDFNRADQLNQELIDLFGFGLDYDSLREVEENYED